MNHVGRLLAVAGLVLAVVLFARDDSARIGELVLHAGPGLVLAGLFHIVPMIANARAWQVLLPLERRIGIATMTWAIWLRESVNGLLPVARVGGEIVSYRLLRRHLPSRSDVAASLVADMALSMLSQAGFAVLGLALLLTVDHTSAATTQLLAAAVFLALLGAAFLVVQRGSALSGLTRLLDRVSSGKLGAALGQSERIEAALRAVYARRADVLACFAWQLSAWLLGAGEIWLALYFLGHSPSVLDAVVIEALVQAISSAAFVVPGALGVQEGGFLLIGAALGIDSTTALALAGARRLRDVIVFFPGLLAWQWEESRMSRAKRSTDAKPDSTAGRPTREQQS